MPAADSPPASIAPEKGVKPVKHDQKAFERQVEDVSDDLISLRKHLTTALDALFRTDQEPVKIDGLLVDIASLQLDQQLDRHNASARNYNAAMDRNSDFLIQVKGTNRKNEFFNKYINGFPEKPADIECMSGKDAIKILDALSIEHRHDTDPDLRFTNDPSWDPFNKHGHGHKGHHHHTNGVQSDAVFNLSEARLTRLRRQVRVAYGLSPFHFKPVVINAIDGNDI